MIGSGLALSVLAPQHHRDAVVRAVVGIVFGFVFAHPAYHLIAPVVGDAGEVWNLMTGATVAAFASWSVVSVAAATLGRWKVLGDIRNSFRPTPPKKKRRKKRKAKVPGPQS
jgi:hypothetical protein